MNREQSLELFAKGKDAWNAWANGMLAEKKRLQDAGTWEAERSRWEDEAKVDFRSHPFTEIAAFSGYFFPCEADFKNAVFSQNTQFDHVSFSGNTWFNDVMFSSDISFENAEFKHIAWFYNTTFCRMTVFDGAELFGPANFMAMFKGSTNFLDTKFIANPTLDGSTAFSANFGAMKSERNFNLNGSKFEQVPDFTQAHFVEAPSLDRISVGPERKHLLCWLFSLFLQKRGCREETSACTNLPPSPHGEPVEPEEGGGVQVAILRQAQDEDGEQAQDETKGQAPDKKVEQARTAREKAAQADEAKEIPSRWRHLRRLATQGQDHQNEQYFFAEELKSRRGVFDHRFGKNWQNWWAGWLYQIFSDFGRSIWRPFAWWFSITIAYAATLLLTHDFIALTRPAFILGPNGCLLGDSTPWSTALKSAFDNAFLLPVFGVSEGQVQEQLCLFGHDIGLKMPNLPPVPFVPAWISLAGATHTVFSATMIFLILLAIRNQFRIR